MYYLDCGELSLNHVLQRLSLLKTRAMSTIWIVWSQIKIYEYYLNCAKITNQCHEYYLECVFSQTRGMCTTWNSCSIQHWRVPTHFWLANEILTCKNKPGNFHICLYSWVVSKNNKLFKPAVRFPIKEAPNFIRISTTPERVLKQRIIDIHIGPTTL